MRVQRFSTAPHGTHQRLTGWQPKGAPAWRRSYGGFTASEEQHPGPRARCGRGRGHPRAPDRRHPARRAADHLLPPSLEQAVRGGRPPDPPDRGGAPGGAARPGTGRVMRGGQAGRARRGDDRRRAGRWASLRTRSRPDRGRAGDHRVRGGPERGHRAAARGHLGERCRRAPDRPRGPPRCGVRPARPERRPRSRPPLHRPGLPRRDAGRGRDPAGRLRAGALARLERRLEPVDGDLGRRHGARPHGGADGVPAGRRGAASPALPHRSDARQLGCAIT